MWVRVTENIVRIEEFAETTVVLACDANSALGYGEIKRDLRAKGRPIPDNDIWIAAVAKQYSLTLATRDEHFHEVEGLMPESR